MNTRPWIKCFFIINLKLLKNILPGIKNELQLYLNSLVQNLILYYLTLNSLTRPALEHPLFYKLRNEKNQLLKNSAINLLESGPLWG
jgi:hypothetical protein